jgi:UDP-N-acetylglucosamine 4,6-dehydratase/5-epimerase
MNNQFENKTLLITGGTGSFGNAVLDIFLNSNIKEIRIFSRDEKKQDEMRHIYNNDKIKFYIGDVRDITSLDSSMRGVDYVFSAAALKQVPSCEFYPLEAVYTNVLGTSNTIDSAIKNNVQKLIVLSTDKAVYPINAMGMSKALMEKIMIAKTKNLEENNTILSATRYGNVMASRGSVIPLFTDLIKKNNEIMITDPDMTRFMMSLPQAVELVMFAFTNSTQGDTFIQKAPAATIMTLVEALCEIFQKKVRYKIIGTRHGEKKHEALLSREEFIKAEDMGNYYRIPVDNRDLNYSKYFEYGKKELSTMTDYTSENTYRLNKNELIDILLKLDYIKEQIK